MKQNRILVIWNDYGIKSNSNKNDYFYETCINNFKNNTAFKEYFKVIKKNNIDILFNDDNFKNISDKIDEKKYLSVFVLAELNVNEKDFYGIKLIENIRLKNIKIPIFVCSIKTKVDLYNNLKDKEILKTPSVYFIDIISKTLDLKTEKSINTLSDSLLEEIKYYAINKEGKIRNLFHDLKNNYNDKQALIWFKKQIYILSPKNKKVKIDSFVEEISVIIKKSKDVYNELTVIENKIIELLPNNTISKNKKIYSKNNDWQVLYIEDDKKHRDLVKKNLNEFGLNCITAENGNEGIEILEKDYLGKLKNNNNEYYPQNSITVVICDLRLQNKLKEWYALQGLDIINKIYTDLNNLMSFFVLSSKEGKIKQNIGKKNSVNILWYVKNILTNKDAFEIFAERIIEEGNKIYTEILNRPVEKSWNIDYFYKDERNNKFKIKEGLGGYYRALRLGSDYYKINEYINKRAKEYVDYALAVISTEENDITPEIPIKLEIKKALPEDAFINGEVNKKMQKIFINKLIGRRVAIGLYLRSKIGIERVFGSEFYDEEPISDFTVPDDIVLLLRKEGNRIIKSKNKIEYVNGLVKGSLNTWLALPKDIFIDIPHNLLIEEINWVEQYLEIPLDKNKLDIKRRFYKEISVIMDDVIYKIKQNIDDKKYNLESLDEYINNDGITIYNSENLKSYLNSALDTIHKCKKNKQKEIKIYFAGKIFNLIKSNYDYNIIIDSHKVKTVIDKILEWKK